LPPSIEIRAASEAFVRQLFAHIGARLPPVPDGFRANAEVVHDRRCGFPCPAPGLWDAAIVDSCYDAFTVAVEAVDVIAATDTPPHHPHPLVPVGPAND
jgi:hypothetical protein